MKKWIMITLGLLSMAAVATAAVAGPGRGPGYGPYGGAERQGINRLDLTTDQMTKINKLRETLSNELGPLHDQMVAKRDALRKLWLETNPDQAKITGAQKEINALRDQMQAKMTTFRLEAMKILTPEQREKAKFYGAGPGFGPGPGMMSGRSGKMARSVPRGRNGMACPGYGPQGPCGMACPGQGYGPMMRHW